jgi:O-antigen/teichoic acid export membrane protein
MTEQQTSYRNIMKATSLFGGVQVFNIIIQIIRSKFVAVLLGPHGMGISGLIYSTIGLIKAFTDFGLGTSAVKDIAAANATGDEEKISNAVTVIRRLVWITGTLGALITLVFSRLLSQLTFGNHDFTFAFVWVSITLLFNQLSSGQVVLLQGMRRLQDMAKANLIGSTLGLFVTIPLYYIWGIKGIVPGIIVTSSITLSLSWYFSHKVKIKPLRVSFQKTMADGRSMLNMGFMISISGTVGILTSYVVRIFIRNHGGIEQVGFYNAGFSLLDTYVGLIFAAMSTDYYPRLTAVAKSNEQCKYTINQQVEIALLLLAPILVGFLIFIKWVVILLYSTKFTPINEMIYWASVGIFFKAPGWAISFILLAKGAAKLYFWNEMLARVYFLALNILGYYYLGLAGLGISFMAGYLIYLVQTYMLSKRNFEFSFDRELIKIFIIQFSLIIGSFIAVKFLSAPFVYIVGTLLVVISGHYSIKELDKRIGIKMVLLNLRDRFFKKK